MTAPSSNFNVHPRAIERILDANLDRAREGLRAIEDWFRFALEDRDRAAICKDLRQQLAQWHADRYVAARDTPRDPGTVLAHPAEMTRQDITHLLRANCSRVQEALRTVEEYAKLERPEMAAACEQARYRVYALESSLFGRKRRDRLQAARLYLITHPVPDWLAAVEAALAGGVRVVQYRRKECDYRQLLVEARQVKALCERYEALAIVNDRVDLALDIDADGVHLGQTDMEVATARRLLGPHKLIGQSTTNADELEAALATTADYIGVGPVYATPTKPGKAAAGFDYVRLAAARATVPWFAIGGIAPDTLAPTLAAGATRVAVVRSLMSALDPRETAGRMLTALDAATRV
ncbi:MAG: thiamine phosphate synthase [Cyanobacteria bacterium P01_F01_bin.33]